MGVVFLRNNHLMEIVYLHRHLMGVVYMRPLMGVVYFHDSHLMGIVFLRNSYMVGVVVLLGDLQKASYVMNSFD